MNASASGLVAEPLLFSWEAPRRRRAAVTAFVALSLIAHALCFYIFQIVYPPTVSLLPPPARVSVITSNSEEGRTLLRWVDSEDPALAFTTQRPAEARLRVLPKVEHIPSYLAAEPSLKQVPPPVADLRIPSSQPAGAVPFVYRQTASAIYPRETSASFSKELDAFGAPRFRVAISGRGEIRYCFPLNSSGDPALDEQARRYLALCRFSQSSISGEKVDRSLTWGIATVGWGNDVAHPRHTPTSTSAP